MLRVAILLGMLVMSCGVATADPARSYPARVLCQSASQVRPLMLGDIVLLPALAERRDAPRQVCAGGASRARIAKPYFALVMGIGF